MCRYLLYILMLEFYKVNDYLRWLWICEGSNVFRHANHLLLLFSWRLFFWSTNHSPWFGLLCINLFCMNDSVFYRHLTTVYSLTLFRSFLPDQNELNRRFFFLGWRYLLLTKVSFLTFFTLWPQKTFVSRLVPFFPMGLCLILNVSVLTWRWNAVNGFIHTC